MESILEIPGERAKITGLICIGSASMAVLFASSSLYFVFLFFSAVSGLFAYSEIKAIGSGWISSFFLLLSFSLLFVSLLANLTRLSSPVVFWGKGSDEQAAFIYGICAIVIPIMLTAFALITKNIATRKAFVPLAIPVLQTKPRRETIRELATPQKVSRHTDLAW